MCPRKPSIAIPIFCDQFGAADLQYPSAVQRTEPRFPLPTHVHRRLRASVCSRGAQQQPLQDCGRQVGAESLVAGTGIRQDAWANAHRIPVEEEKDARLKGFYIHPELYGQPAEKQIEWARHPQMMKQMQEEKKRMKEKRAKIAAPAKP